MNFEDELHILFLLSVAGVSSMLCACVCTYIGFTHLSFSQHDITTRNFSAIYQHNSLFFAECAKFPSIDSRSLFSAFTTLDSTLVLLPNGNGRNVETWILNTLTHSLDVQVIHKCTCCETINICRGIKMLSLFILTYLIYPEAGRLYGITCTHTRTHRRVFSMRRANDRVNDRKWKWYEWNGQGNMTRTQNINWSLSFYHTSIYSDDDRRMTTA